MSAQNTFLMITLSLAQNYAQIPLGVHTPFENTDSEADGLACFTVGNGIDQILNCFNLKSVHTYDDMTGL